MCYDKIVTFGIHTHVSTDEKQLRRLSQDNFRGAYSASQVHRIDVRTFRGQIL